MNQNSNTSNSGIMGFLSSKKMTFIYLAILIIAWFKVYSEVFDEKINLGGDNAGYYILGNALANGDGYTNIHTLNKTPHNHFPPGYPVIIATTIKLFSNDIVTIKRVSGFFFLLSIGMIFIIIARITDNYHVAFLVSALCIVNVHMLTYATIMMSEIPFLFFSLLCLWLFIDLDFSGPFWKNWKFLVFILVLVFTYHIRSTALALIAAMMVYLLITRNWLYLASFVVGVAALMIPWMMRTSSLGGSSYMKQIVMINPYRPELGGMELADWFSRFWENLERYLTREIPSGVFNFLKVTNYNDPITSKEWVIGLIIFAIMLFGLTRIKKYGLLIFLYLGASFGILLLWPPVWTGQRFLLPLIPILAFLFIYGTVHLIKKLAETASQKSFSEATVSVFLIILMIVGMKSYAGPSIDTLSRQAKGKWIPRYQNYFDLAKWAGQNLPDTSVISCRKQQLFYVYSNRYVAGYKYTLDAEDLIEALKASSVDYVILDQLGYSSTGRYLLPAIKKYPEKFQNVAQLKNPDTYLLKFEPQLGYWGEWKDNKRNGMGSYTWKSNQKYVGQWENGLRNGKGTLYLPDGTTMEGRWTDDKLNGEVIVKGPNGDIIRTENYLDNQKLD
ncbi:glycosyltransferase family 39 protein [Marinoscillum sp. MHG1-6]|uniref:glycosyltransferase family 39 protein n=1 Tax=Marinoscillum sp. MHG1-6 TaxID=2959627 RepID=UPI00215824E9|nr:glycosyltransferase family 39 protein [Marinoscillum sp. MHG1-6]